MNNHRLVSATHQIFIFSILVFSCTKVKNTNASYQTTEITYKKSDYQERWPFAVDEITVCCAHNNEVYFKSEDRFYPLNGKAKDATKRDFGSIWLNNPDFPGTKIPVPSEFISNALKTCH